VNPPLHLVSDALAVAVGRSTDDRAATRVATDVFSPSQMLVPMTRMSAASTFSRISGQSSRSQPCSRMSG